MATRANDLWLSFGVMGGFQQAQGHLQVIVNMVDFGLDPQSALDSRRFNVNNDGSTSLEQDVPANVIDALRRLGHRITDYSGSDDVFYGGGQIIARDPSTGVLTAGSDPRKDGCALGW
jgi:gamma-glutamyltranspeptidase/glutathione hydrolase